MNVGFYKYNIFIFRKIVDFCEDSCKDYQRVNELIAPTPTVKYPRTPGYRETKDDSWSVYTENNTFCIA